MSRVSPPTATGVLVTLAASFSLIAWGLSRHYPSLGMKPLVLNGGLIILLVVGLSVDSRKTSSMQDRHMDAIRAEVAKQEAAESFRDAERLESAAEAVPESNPDRVESDREAREASLAVRADADLAAELEARAEASREEGAVWPVLVAVPIFLYLWWLSALLFDLTFFWHRFIRHSAGVRTLDEVASPRAGREPVPVEA